MLTKDPSFEEVVLGNTKTQIKHIKPTVNLLSIYLTNFKNSSILANTNIEYSRRIFIKNIHITEYNEIERVF